MRYLARQDGPPILPVMRYWFESSGSSRMVLGLAALLHGRRVHSDVNDLCRSGQPPGCSPRQSRESLRLSEPGHLEQCHIGIGFVLLLSAAEPQPLSRGYPLIRNGPKMATRGELSSSRLRYRPKTIPNAAPNGIPIPIQTGF